MSRIIEAATQLSLPPKESRSLESQNLPDSPNHQDIYRITRDISDDKKAALLIYYLRKFSQDGQRDLDFSKRQLLYHLLYSDFPQLRDILLSLNPNDVLTEADFDIILSDAYDYSSLPVEKYLIADIFENFIVPTSKFNEYLLYRFFLDRFQNPAPGFNSKLMHYEKDNVYIGGLPLFDRRGRYIFTPGYQGVIIAKNGAKYDINSDPKYVEINLKGRQGQQTDEPGYFKLKKESSYGESIIVTKVPGEKGQRDPNLYYRLLLEHLMDTYPFQCGPILRYRSEWRDGDNRNTFDTVYKRLDRIVGKKEDRLKNRVARLLPETSDTPFASQTTDEIINSLRLAIVSDIAERQRYDHSYHPTREVIDDEVVERLIKQLASWQTPTGKVLFHHLGFNSVAMPQSIAYYSRSIAMVINREEKLAVLRQSHPLI